MTPLENPLHPSWRGYIASTTDALMIMEAYLTGLIAGVPRRPRYAEQHSLIKSGNVLIFEEHSSSIKRWTDGLRWGPSRVLGNFLIYRELDDACDVVRKPTNQPKTARTGRKRLTERSTANVVGSFGDWHNFKKDGLVKKTISVQIPGHSFHLVSYFTMEDIMQGRLWTPSMEPGLQQVVPRMELIRSESIRKPIDGVEQLGTSCHSLGSSTAASPPGAVWDSQQWEFLQNHSSFHPMIMSHPSVIQ
ncbi:Gluconate transport-inducing protein required for gluconate-H+ symport [Conoideocrella luteorostrata]|uniref:Gluconate transport-inducing protein required for gluconate-H+ symport n=1 Tax=Conoideocrella luteorostrata TaxID=1105319 RepID=A0AAJ0CXQ1_9HYPO|nr:Gluconate transport-inducing protein required for gluconate-H+ symport [Conoideocrella luteorostrata]